MENIKKENIKYFVIAIIILIILGVVLIIHFNNKKLVNGDIKDNHDNNIKEETTKKEETEEVIENVVVNYRTNNVVMNDVPVYKSTIDNNLNFVYTYKLTDEILDTDKIISTKVDIDDNLKTKNIVALYDINLYDIYLNKKDLNNSLITIKIPIDETLKKYENYKVVYLNDYNEITNEEFETTINDEYIEFKTTHLSKYGIIGTKKAIDLSNVTLNIRKNNVNIEDYSNINASTADEFEISVNNLDEEYEIYYLLKNDKEIIDYMLFKPKMFSDITAVNKYDLNIKLKVGSQEKIFEIGKVNIYDIVYEYDKNSSLSEDIGIIYNDDGSLYKKDENDYNYDDMDINKDILIEPVEEEVEEEQQEVIGKDEAVINIYGNAYVVSESDISKLNITGYLIIDTTENVIIDKENLDNVYKIIINSEEFMINGEKYTCIYEGNNIKLEKVKEEHNEEASLEEILDTDKIVISDEVEETLKESYQVTN